MGAGASAGLAAASQASSPDDLKSAFSGLSRDDRCKLLCAVKGESGGGAAAASSGGDAPAAVQDTNGTETKKSDADDGSSWTLKPHATIPKATKPVVVVILDGWGENAVKDEYNAVHTAKTPNYDRLFAVPGRSRIVAAHGPAVGLPTKDDMGNSEVGHNALGGGQVVDQGAKLVDQALANGDIFKSDGFKYVETQFATNTVHLIGLLGWGGIHSRYDQMIGLIRGIADRGAKKIRLHLLTDGRDVADGTSKEYAATLESDLAEVRAKGVDVLCASGGGRMGVTMDRYESDWRIVEKGWKAHVLGEAEDKFKSYVDAVNKLTDGEGDKFSDQWLPPFVITGADDKPVGTIEDGDAVILFNFRADRMAEISAAFEYEEFTKFDRKRFPKTKFAGMFQYDGDTMLPANFLCDAPSIKKTSGEFLCKNGVTTYACTETQKFGHVTFFWNGNRSGYVDEAMEKYECIESDRVVFNEKPLMKAREITDAVLREIKAGTYNMIRCNYANPDMVGHTGDLKATIESCEFVDQCMGEVIAAAEEAGGRWLVTADHGNADDMVQRQKKTNEPLKNKETGKIEQHKAHTLAPVPVMIGGDLPAEVTFKDGFLPDAGLANVTATYINLLGLEAPDFYAPSLL